jgi:hypothetical protein
VSYLSNLYRSLSCPNVRGGAGGEEHAEKLPGMLDVVAQGCLSFDMRSGKHNDGRTLISAHAHGADRRVRDE